jgi:hypothetical protein
LARPVLRVFRVLRVLRGVRVLPAQKVNRAFRVRWVIAVRLVFRDLLARSHLQRFASALVLMLTEFDCNT